MCHIILSHIEFYYKVSILPIIIKAYLALVIATLIHQMSSIKPKQLT